MRKLSITECRALQALSCTRLELDTIAVAAAKSWNMPSWKIMAYVSNCRTNDTVGLYNKFVLTDEQCVQVVMKIGNVLFVVRELLCQSCNTNIAHSFADTIFSDMEEFAILLNYRYITAEIANMRFDLVLPGDDAHIVAFEFDDPSEYPYFTVRDVFTGYAMAVAVDAIVVKVDDFRFPTPEFDDYPAYASGE